MNSKTQIIAVVVFLVLHIKTYTICGVVISPASPGIMNTACFRCLGYLHKKLQASSCWPHTDVGPEIQERKRSMDYRESKSRGWAAAGL